MIFTYFSQELFSKIDLDDEGDIYQKELVFYLKKMNGGNFDNLKVR